MNDTTNIPDACRRCGSPPSEDGLHGGSVCPPCGETEAKGTSADTVPPPSLRERAERAVDAIVGMPVGKLPRPWREMVADLIEREIAAAVEDGCAYLKRVEDWARAGEVRAAEEQARDAVLCHVEVLLRWIDVVLRSNPHLGMLLGEKGAHLVLRKEVEGATKATETPQ